MREFLIITAREWRERVLSRAFVLGTVLVPLSMGAALWFPQWSLRQQGEVERRIVIVDDAPEGVARGVQEALGQSGEPDPPLEPDRVAPPAGAGDPQPVFQVTIEPGPLEGARASLHQRVRDGVIDGYLALGPAVLDGADASYRARNVSNFMEIGALEDAVTEAVRRHRLAGAGLDPGRLAELMGAVDLDTARLTSEGTEGGDSRTTFFVGYVIAFTLYMLIVLYGNAVMLSVVEEKSSRIVEVLLSSVEAPQLMAGKILGVGAAALLQVGIWAACAAVLLFQPLLALVALELPEGVLQALHLPWYAVPSFLAYLVLGFVLYAAIFAAIGAAAATQQEAQQLSMAPVFVLVAPMVMGPAVASNPDGGLALFLSEFPFTSPLIMPSRIGAGEVPFWQVLVSLALLGTTAVATTWMAGRIYRIGILATGSRATLANLMRWIRMGS